MDNAGSIVSKAIRDGGIDASMNHSKGWMQSKETLARTFYYSTQIRFIENKTFIHVVLSFL